MKQVLEEGSTACRPTRPMVLDRLMNNRGAISAAIVFSVGDAGTVLGNLTGRLGQH